MALVWLPNTPEAVPSPIVAVAVAVAKNKRRRGRQREEEEAQEKKRKTIIKRTHTAKKRKTYKRNNLRRTRKHMELNRDPEGFLKRSS